MSEGGIYPRAVPCISLKWEMSFEKVEGSFENNELTRYDYLLYADISVHVTTR